MADPDSQKHPFPDAIVETDDCPLEDVRDGEHALPSLSPPREDRLGDHAEVLLVGILEQRPRRDADGGGQVEGVWLALKVGK